MGGPPGLDPGSQAGAQHPHLPVRGGEQLFPAVLPAPHRHIHGTRAHPPAHAPGLPGQDPDPPRQDHRDAHAEDHPAVGAAGEHPAAPRPGADHAHILPGVPVLRHRAGFSPRVRGFLLALLPLLEA